MNTLASTVCHPHYEERIRNLEKLLIPARGALINTTAGAVISQPVLLSLGLLTPVGAITVGAAVVGSASYTMIVVSHIKQYKNVLRIYAHRDSPQSKIYKKVFKKFNNNEVLMEQFLDNLKRGMEDGQYCQYDETKEKYVLSKFRKITQIK